MAESASGRSVRTKHADLSLEDIARALPGTGELMVAVGRCYAMCWHSAHGGNWELATYFMRRVRSLLRTLVVVRPQYGEQSQDYDQQFLEPIYQALLSQDLWAFDSAYESGTDQANLLHVDTGHPYIRWTRPEAPPDQGLELGPA